MSNNPAILGGSPAFDKMVPMVRPVLPGFEQLEEGVRAILNTGMVTKGPYMQAFEKAAAEHLGVKHAVALSSCTSGLILTHKGLGLTGEVVAPSFTFMATIASLVWNGLRPVFADVDPATTNLDPAAAEAAITPRTSALIAVHNFGAPADIAGLQAVADRHGLKLIFDAAHGFGARYQGQPVGGQGDAQVFSLSPTKLLIAGEGGIVSTNNDDLAARLRMGREYGNDGNYDTAFAGLNARMPELSALLGLHSLENLEHAAESRNETAAIFHETMGCLPGVTLQQVRPGDRHSYREYSIVIEPAEFGISRDDLARALAVENIDTRKYYYPPAHRQTAYREYYDGQPLPHTEWLANNSLSFPMWTDMSPDVALRIAEAVQRIQRSAPQVGARLAEQA
jgi:dTDP-4-amino-4,6-dideoxygalactose transaminase